MNFFWYSGQFSAGPSEDFSKLLADPESPLELVLSADEAVTQAKRRLIELVSILAEEPPAECSFDRGHKFPFAASELLSASAPEMLDKVLAAPDVLQHLLTLVERPVTNLTSTAYLANAIAALLSRSNTAYQFAFSDSRLATAVVKSLYSKSMADLAFKLLFLDNAVNAHYLLERFGVIKGLVRSLAQGCSLEEQTNAGSVLCDIVRNSEAKSWKLLVCAIVQKEELEEVFKSVVAGSAAALGVLNALLSCEVLGELSEINLQKVIRVVQSPSDGTKEEPEEDDEDREDALITLLGEYLPSVLKLLSADSTQVGAARLQITELVDTMLKQKSPFFEEIIVREGGLQQVTSLFFQHPLNSFLQKSFESIVHTVLEKASISVQRHLLLEVNLPSLLAKAASSVPGCPGNSGLCNMGYITRIAAYISSKKAEFQWWTEDSLWVEFENGYLDQVGKLEKPKKRANSDDEAEFNNPEESEPIADDESPEDDDEEGEISLNSLITPPSHPSPKKYSQEELKDLCGATRMDEDDSEGEYATAGFWRVPVNAGEDLEELE